MELFYAQERRRALLNADIKCPPHEVGQALAREEGARTLVPSPLGRRLG